MTKRLLHTIFLSGILFFGSISLGWSQDRPSEEQVETEKLFIDATREKILGNYENSAFLFKEVLKRDKRNHAAAYELARLYDVLDKPEKAMASIKMAISGDENPWYRMFKADIYDRKGEFGEGAKIFENLVNENPYNEYYYIKWAFLLVKNKQPEKAIAAYSKMEHINGITEEISRKKATLYLGTGQPEQAINQYQLLVESDPYNIEFYHLLAGLYHQLGDDENAIKVYQQILDIDPNNATASLALAETKKEEGNELSYFNSLKPVFEKPDVDIDLKIKELLPYIQKAVNESDIPQMTAMLDLTKILENRHPQEAKAFAVSGDLLYYSGEKQSALKKYNKAKSLDGKVYSIYEQIMQINVENKNFDSLLEVSNEAMDVFPNQASAYYFNGVALGQQEKHKAAISSYQQALLMSRKNPRLQFDLFYRLGETYHKLGKSTLSNKNFEKALKLNPKDYNLLNTYSSCLAERGQELEKAKSMSALSNELQPNQPEFQDTYGWVLYQMKEYDGAKEWLTKALDNGGNTNPTILEHYGDILFQLGKKDAAIAEWQKALDANGGKNEVLEGKIEKRQL